jgi:hypothetical protein
MHVRLETFLVLQISERFKSENRWHVRATQQAWGMNEHGLTGMAHYKHLLPRDRITTTTTLTVAWLRTIDLPCASLEPSLYHQQPKTRTRCATSKQPTQQTTAICSLRPHVDHNKRQIDRTEINTGFCSLVIFRKGLFLHNIFVVAPTASIRHGGVSLFAQVYLSIALMSRLGISPGPARLPYSSATIGDHVWNPGFCSIYPCVCLSFASTTRGARYWY